MVEFTLLFIRWLSALLKEGEPMDGRVHTIVYQVAGSFLNSRIKIGGFLHFTQKFNIP
jgi:hypothetical protein